MDPYIGEIRIFGGNFPPRDWAFCDGQLISIPSNPVLYTVLGTKYGGDGKTTFALPNLRGSAPMNQGEGPALTPRVAGETGGDVNITLLQNDIPAHTHVPNACVTPTADTPTGAKWSSTVGRGSVIPYSNTSDGTQLSPQAIGTTGGTQPHNNMQPYLGLSFIICVSGGNFPSKG
ncbi:phage tail protein [Brevibacillus sp. BC25]|uniref:phage tail protein n=1 Tax=Brevibacillus sp. BC25 TaxID=1144308 RepID=UPI0002714F84|nr:tail fiber protein [Brevibacillus sp. BC25]EJL21651.1 microcystin-dependent protein [Brevibacillus sp. BC25]